MKKLLIALAALTLIAGMAYARPVEDAPRFDSQAAPDVYTTIYYEDMNSGAPGWYSVDESVMPSEFHVDTYYAYPDGTPPDYSYWCGRIDATYISGDGYGNAWNMMLGIPLVDWTGAYYPICTYCYRYDSEVAYDFTWFEAKQGGAYQKMNPGYDGKSGGWQCYGAYGFVMSAHDNPMDAMFHFVSDGAWSDEDGLYDSTAGAFHCDEIEVFDFYGGAQYFFDDVEDGVGLCFPILPNPAGDFWHLVTDRCSSYSSPVSWWCGDDADTSLIPPNLMDALYSPIIDISSCVTCTFRYAIHAEVPQVDNDFWTNSVSTDGGVTWYQTGAWWGDFGQCGGWGTAGLTGDVLDPYLPGTGFQYKLRFHTTDNGCGPGTAGGAGINLDDSWLVGDCNVAVEESSWGNIKAMFK